MMEKKNKISSEMLNDLTDIMRQAMKVDFLIESIKRETEILMDWIHNFKGEYDK